MSASLKRQVAELRAQVEGLLRSRDRLPDWCEACGVACWRDVTLSREQWMQVAPGPNAGGGGGGYLCARCIAERGSAVEDLGSCHMVFSKRDYEFWHAKGFDGPLWAVLRPWGPEDDSAAPDRTASAEALPKHRSWWDPGAA